MEWMNRAAILAVASSALGLSACDDDTPAPSDSGVDVVSVDTVTSDVVTSDVVTPDGAAGNDATTADTPTVSDGATDAATPGDAPDAATPSMYTATLSGRQEVPAVYTTSASGTATFLFNADRTIVTYMVTHTILAPTAAHIHLGLAGESGAVAVPLSSTPAVIAGTVGVTPEQRAAIEEGRAYVNIHSAAFPDGEIRGQIVRPGETVWTARLSGDQENPPTASTATGLGEFLVNGSGGVMRYLVRTTLSAPPTMAHIHTGAIGVNGPVTIDFASSGAILGATFSGTRPVTSTTDLEAGRWYVNTHSTMFPSGEIRGQLLRPGEVAYVGRMTGAEEVPPVTTMASGSVGVIVGADRNRLTYDGALSNIDPTAAHLHMAPAGMNGAVVVPFTLTGTSLRGTFMIPAGSTLLADLDAGNIYANAHSSMYTGGEIRGQMRRIPATP